MKNGYLDAKEIDNLIRQTERKQREKKLKADLEKVLLSIALGLAVNLPVLAVAGLVNLKLIVVLGFAQVLTAYWFFVFILYAKTED